MGTRSLTHFKGEDNNTICTMYGQYDGYPEGMGKDLADFLIRGKLVNGIPGGANNQLFFNGMGCLIAQVIAHLKEGAGNVYIYPPDADDCWEEYTYTVGVDNDEVYISCDRVHDNKKYTPKEFLELISQGLEDDEDD